MYKVFRDPEGTRYLNNNASTASVNNKAATSRELEIYRQRIQSLNIEVIRLNDELEMVIMCSV